MGRGRYYAPRCDRTVTPQREMDNAHGVHRARECGSDARRACDCVRENGETTSAARPWFDASDVSGAAALCT